MERRKNRIRDGARAKNINQKTYIKQLKEKSIANGKEVKAIISSLGWEIK